MPLVTSPAPQFSAQAVVGNEIVSLSWEQIHEGKWLCLFFYPLDFTFICPTEIVAFSEAASKFEALDAKIAGVSVDSQFTHLAWVNTPRNKGGIGEINFPLISDLNKDIAKSYDVLLGGGVALRALFIIDPKGTVRHATINDLPVGRNVEEALRVITAFQFVEANGEVCPANWTPGADTMKPDPVGSQEYFAKQ